MGPAGTSERMYGPCGAQRGFMTQRRHQNLRTVTDRYRSNPIHFGADTTGSVKAHLRARPQVRTRFTCLDPRGPV